MTKIIQVEKIIYVLAFTVSILMIPILYLGSHTGNFDLRWQYKILLSPIFIAPTYWIAKKLKLQILIIVLLNFTLGILNNILFFKEFISGYDFVWFIHGVILLLGNAAIIVGVLEIKNINKIKKLNV